MTRRVFNRTPTKGTRVFAAWEREVGEVWDDFRIEPERFIDAGNRVIVIETRRARGKGSGVEVEMRSGVVWTLSDGKIVRMETDLDPDEAVRLSEQDAHADS